VILARLKEETRLLHAAVEGRLNLLDPNLTRDAYAAVLARFLGFYAPLEERLARVDGYDAVGLNLDERRKAHRIVADLAALGRSPNQVAAVPVCPDVPDPRTLAEALGCLYVMEGATLGGQIICRHVGPALGLDAGAGCSLFASYGDRVGAMWRAFGDALAAYAVAPNRADAVVRSACETFTKLDAWLISAAR
jgi:heme oxygenase